MALSLPAAVAIVATVIVAIVLAFAGRPAARPHVWAAFVLLGCGIGGLVLATGVLEGISDRTGALIAAASSCAIALSAWLFRASQDGPGGSGDAPGPGADDDPRGGGDAPPAAGPRTAWDWSRDRADRRSDRTPVG